MAKVELPQITPKTFTFDVHFVLQVLAKDKKEAEKICFDSGGYIVSRLQTIREEI